VEFAEDSPMPEVVLPGTYIEVRAEGLISAGRVATGNIGLVGTAAKGPINEVKILGNLSEAKDIFGDSDDWKDGKSNELTLIRALELIYQNGGQTVYAVRTAKDKGFSAATYNLKSDTTNLLTLTAKGTPGSWGNQIVIEIVDAGTDRKEVNLTYKTIEETYPIENVGDLANQIGEKSVLVEASKPSQANKNKLPDNTKNREQFSQGSDGADATDQDYQTSLALLENEIINIVLLAGQDSSKSAMVKVLEGHLKATAEIKRERIGIIGSGFDDKGQDKLDHNLNNPRLIFTAPGILVTTKGQQNKLPGGYLAAAVAGLIASIPVQTSPTNKILTIEGLTTELNSSQLAKLVSSRILAVEKRNGYRIVKGITTSEAPWEQITTRRIVDYAIYGVRSSCDPYIGKLNNERVRGAMKATLNAFLTRMVESEALVGYQLEVSATRDDEKAGQVKVTMTLLPTFSIDFIMVTMYLS
jgi:hypothetical protein